MKTGLIFSGGIASVDDQLSTVVLVGDSIHWGYNLEVENTIAYYMQQKINASYGYDPATWGINASWGVGDIVARSITTDDVSNKTSFNGGTTDVSRHITGSGNITNPTVGMMPFSANTYSSTGGTVTSISGWNNGGIALSTNTGSGVGKLSFKINYPGWFDPTPSRSWYGLNAYLTLKLMGSGSIKVTMNSTYYSSTTTNIYQANVGGYIHGSVTSGNNKIYVYGRDGYYYDYSGSHYTYYVSDQAGYTQPKIDSYIYSTGFPTGSSALRITSWNSNLSGLINDPNNIMTLSNNSPFTGGYTFEWSAAHPIEYKIGPFNNDGFHTAYDCTIECVSGSPVITGLHPFTRAEAAMPIVQIHARNNYGITDYYSSNVTRAATIIRQNTFINPSFGEIGYSTKYAAYIVCCGVFNIIDSANSRRLTPTQYYTALYNLAYNLKYCPSVGDLSSYSQWIPNSNVRVILTIPPTPIGWSPPTGYTFGDYKTQIIKAANNLGFSYVDLSTVLTSSDDYQSDGLHPNATGAEKIANRYINMLQLLKI